MKITVFTYMNTRKHINVGDNAIIIFFVYISIFLKKSYLYTWPFTEMLGPKTLYVSKPISLFMFY